MHMPAFAHSELPRPVPQSEHLAVFQGLAHFRIHQAGTIIRMATALASTNSASERVHPPGGDSGNG
jgi:hypothetical protein